MRELLRVNVLARSLRYALVFLLKPHNLLCSLETLIRTNLIRYFHILETFVKYLFIFSLLYFLTACGGSGGGNSGSGEATPTPTEAPSATPTPTPTTTTTPSPSPSPQPAQWNASNWDEANWQ